MKMFGSDTKEYDLKAEITTCCYGIGTVYLAKHRSTREYVALKRFKMDKAKEECNLIRVSLIYKMYSISSRLFVVYRKRFL